MTELRGDRRVGAKEDARVDDDAPPAPGDGSPVTEDGLRGEAGRTRRGTRGERTRRRLLDSAEEIFAAIGFHDASIVKITEAAGVAQGTFYLYFPSKQEIFDEVVADLNHRVRQAMAEAAAGAGDRLEAERRGFAAFFGFTAEHPALYQVMRQAEFVSPKAYHRHYERIIAGYLPSLGAAMAAGEVAPVDPEVLAWALGAVGEAIGMRFIVWTGAKEVPPEVFEAMMTLIARMLGRDTVAARTARPAKRR